jgi:hypothetical protein
LGKKAAGKEKYTWWISINFKRTVCRRSGWIPRLFGSVTWMFWHFTWPDSQCYAEKWYLDEGRTDLLVAHYWQVGVHTRQLKGRLPPGIGGGRQAASKIELTSIHLLCLAACQASCLASKFGKFNGQTRQLAASYLFTCLASLLASCKPALTASSAVAIGCLSHPRTTRGREANSAFQTVMSRSHISDIQNTIYIPHKAASLLTRTDRLSLYREILETHK